MNRSQLNESNSVNILGAGEVDKDRHSTHNINLANYIDQIRETFSLPTFMTLEGVTQYTFSDLDADGVELISVIIETNPLNVSGANVEATIAGGGVLNITLQAAGQRVYVVYKKKPVFQ